MDEIPERRSAVPRRQAENVARRRGRAVDRQDGRRIGQVPRPAREGHPAPVLFPRPRSDTEGRVRGRRYHHCVVDREGHPERREGSHQFRVNRLRVHHRSSGARRIAGNRVVL